jgi:hypothetical protein
LSAAEGIESARFVSKAQESNPLFVEKGAALVNFVAPNEVDARSRDLNHLCEPVYQALGFSAGDD